MLLRFWPIIPWLLFPLGLGELHVPEGWSRQPLLYFPSHEGLGMHLYELELLWFNTRYSVRDGLEGRQIRLADLQSMRHYGEKDYTLCYYFDFHESIQCESRMSSMRYQAGKGECKMLDRIGDQRWTGVYDDLEKGDLGKPVHNFDWKGIDCVAGFLPIPVWGDTKYWMPWKFSTLSQELLNRVTGDSMPETQTGNYVAVHWRRGDQLTDRNRCASKEDGGPDSSVNCKSPREFITEIWKVMKNFNIDKDLKIFIATNENDNDILNILEDHGMLTLRSIGSKAIDIFEEYIIELQIMCNAGYLINFGKSSAMEAMNDCRHQPKKERSSGKVQKITILDGKRVQAPEPPGYAETEEFLHYFLTQ